MSKLEAYLALLMEDIYLDQQRRVLDGFATRTSLRLNDLIIKAEFLKHRKRNKTVNRLEQDLGRKINKNLTRFRLFDGDNDLAKSGMKREKMDSAGRAQNEKKTLGLGEKSCLA